MMDINLQGIKKLIPHIRSQDPRLYECLSKLIDYCITTSHLLPMNMTQLALSQYIAGLTDVEAGRTFYVTDYNHYLMWDGAKLIWAPGELGSDFYAKFQSDPENVIGWVPADGRKVNILQSDGTLKNVTIAVIAGNWYRI